MSSFKLISLVLALLLVMASPANAVCMHSLSLDDCKAKYQCVGTMSYDATKDLPCVCTATGGGEGTLTVKGVSFCNLTINTPANFTDCASHDYTPYLGQCVTCNTGFHPTGNITEVGQYNLTKKCIACNVEGCLKCTDNDVCSLCTDEYELKEDRCKKNYKMKWWLILIIVLAAVVVVAIVVFVIVYCCCCTDTPCCTKAPEQDLASRPSFISGATGGSRVMFEDEDSFDDDEETYDSEETDFSDYSEDDQLNNKRRR